MKRYLIISLVAVGLFLGNWAGVDSTSQSVYAAPLAPSVCNLTGARIQRSAPAVGNLDTDSDKEIVIGGSDGMLYAINPDCSAVPGWPRQVNNYFVPPVVSAQSATQDIESTPALADIDNDGWLEVIVTVGWMPQFHQNGGVIVFEHTGAVKPGWPKVSLDVNGAGPDFWDPDGFADGVFSTPAVGDVNGDNVPEIVYGSYDKCMYVWEPDGTPAAGWWDTVLDQPARCMVDTIWSSPSLVDLNGDGIKDIVIGMDSNPTYAGGSVWAFTGNNTELWHVETTQIIQSATAVGDINGDGYPEIVVGTGTYYPQGYLGYTDGHKVYAFDRFGNDLPGWPQATGDNMYASPSLADLDNDGKLEILIGEGSEPDFAATGRKLHIFRYDGSDFPGYPRTIKRSNPWTGGGAQDSAGMPYVPIVADYDNNGVKDVFIVHTGSWGISVFPYNNADAVDPAKYVSNNTLISAPLVDNLYNDSRLYMVIGGAISSTDDHGAVYIWQLSNTSSGVRPWPMARYNTQRTGNYPRLAALGISRSSLFLLHQSGTSSSERATLYVSNSGDGSFTWSIASKPSRVTISPASGGPNQMMTITVDTTGLGNGTHPLGNIVINATAPGQTVLNAPQSIPVTLWVGQVKRVHLPMVLK
jgi:hypothetical protein